MAANIHTAGDHHEEDHSDRNFTFLKILFGLVAFLAVVGIFVAAMLFKITFVEIVGVVLVPIVFLILIVISRG